MLPDVSYLSAPPDCIPVDGMATALKELISFSFCAVGMIPEAIIADSPAASPNGQSQLGGSSGDNTKFETKEADMAVAIL